MSVQHCPPLQGGDVGNTNHDFIIIIQRQQMHISIRMHINSPLTNARARAIMRDIKKRQRGRGFTIPFDREGNSGKLYFRNLSFPLPEMIQNQNHFGRRRGFM